MVGAILEKAHFFYSPNKVVFGLNAIHTLGNEVRQLGLKKAFLVTDPGVVKADPFGPEDPRASLAERAVAKPEDCGGNRPVGGARHGRGFVETLGRLVRRLECIEDCLIPQLTSSPVSHCF